MRAETGENGFGKRYHPSLGILPTLTVNPSSSSATIGLPGHVFPPFSLIEGRQHISAANHTLRLYFQ
jgi:hypothetical protein